MGDVLDVHEDAVELAVVLDRVDALLPVRRSNDCMPVESQPLREYVAIDDVVLDTDKQITHSSTNNSLTSTTSTRKL